MILVTYLPFYRVHELLEYFKKNIEIINSEKTFAYVDNVYSPKQLDKINSVIPKNITLKTGNWKNISKLLCPYQ